jgi:hypothetical protein
MSIRKITVLLALLIGTAAGQHAYALSSPGKELQGTAVSGYATSGTSIVLNFSTYSGELVDLWQICWKQGRFNPRPTCAIDENQIDINGNNSNIGTHTVTGLTANRWHTLKVRARYRKSNGGTQVFWRYIGKVEIKTP